MAEPQAPKPAAPVQAKPAAPSAPAAPKQPELRHLVRIANTDLDGQKSIAYALAKIKGVGIPFAFAACRIVGIDVNKKVGALSDAEVKKVEDVVKDPIKAGMPTWMVNRRNDYETGQNKHLLSGDLQFTIENDIKIMKKIKCYKGVRHILGQPVRGQKTRSNFRKNKGKVMGVRRSSGAKASTGGTT
jgi:small subunit ribosomal protein S13